MRLCEKIDGAQFEIHVKKKKMLGRRECKLDLPDESQCGLVIEMKAKSAD
jgi:hypothetical protein